MSTPRYPDDLRRTAIQLHLEGAGYKHIGRQLNLPRDTVRNWVTIYNLTGRTESVQSTGHLRAPKPEKGGRKLLSPARMEELYAAALEEYEQGLDPLTTIARKYGFRYSSLRYFLKQYHPESVVLHAYAKQTAILRESILSQHAHLEALGEKLQEKLKGSLEQALARFKQENAHEQEEV